MVHWFRTGIGEAALLNADWPGFQQPSVIGWVPRFRSFWDRPKVTITAHLHAIKIRYDSQSFVLFFFGEFRWLVVSRSRRPMCERMSFPISFADEFWPLQGSPSGNGRPVRFLFSSFYFLFIFIFYFWRKTRRSSRWDSSAFPSFVSAGCSETSVPPNRYANAETWTCRILKGKSTFDRHSALSDDEDIHSLGCLEFHRGPWIISLLSL